MGHDPQAPRRDIDESELAVGKPKETGRNRWPPLDVFNSALFFGYVILFSENARPLQAEIPSDGVLDFGELVAFEVVHRVTDDVVSVDAGDLDDLDAAMAPHRP